MELDKDGIYQLDLDCWPLRIVCSLFLAFWLVKFLFEQVTKMYWIVIQHVQYFCVGQIWPEPERASTPIGQCWRGGGVLIFLRQVRSKIRLWWTQYLDEIRLRLFQCFPESLHLLWITTASCFLTRLKNKDGILMPISHTHTYTHPLSSLKPVNILEHLMLCY